MMKTEQRLTFLTQVIIILQRQKMRMQQLTIFLRRNLKSALQPQVDFRQKPQQPVAMQTLYLYTHQITQTPT